MLLLKTSIVIPLQPAASADLFKPKESVNMPPPQTLTAFRELIAGSKCGRVTVGDEVSQVRTSGMGFVVTRWNSKLGLVAHSGQFCERTPGGQVCITRSSHPEDVSSEVGV